MANKFLKAFRIKSALTGQILAQKRLVRDADDDYVPALQARLDTLLNRLYVAERYLKM